MADCWRKQQQKTKQTKNNTKQSSEEEDFPENLHHVVYVLINKRSFESLMCLASCLLIYAAAQGEVRKTVAQSPSSVTGQCLTWWSATDPTGQLHRWLVSQRTAFSTSLALK